MNKRQYIRKLERDYQKALKALKGLQTMISNNEAIITQQEQLIESLNRDVETGKLSAEEAERRKEQAQSIIAQKEAIIAEKNEKISVKEAYLSQLTREIKEAGVTISAYRNPKADVSPPQISSQPGIFQSFNNWKAEEDKRLAEAFWKAVDYIEDVYKRDAEAQVNEAKNSKLVDYSELLQLRSESKEADQGNDFLNRILCMLIDQFLDPILHAQVSALATALFDGTYVPTSGGGGCSSDLRWDGRNPGEEEDDYRRRCLTTAAAVIHRQTSRTKSPKR